MVVLNSLAEARAHLDQNPRVWPFIMAVSLGQIGLGPAATEFGMDADDFAKLHQAAREKCDAVVAAHAERVKGRKAA
ncbi:hypothetical protein VT84_09140 [Gemmata sp. SH-PL17]|uniref:hypothetical protein n=1 Tax=Gemmata sp. SH-PL17 TaxID=1630693 RepID=UPI00078BD87D|nr:hypothetical protein [Gemmata sp. SH-PL17]AMV24547.1 hypothetical protein VT84_09140 [Gemmata sp. SH-PL17]